MTDLEVIDRKLDILAGAVLVLAACALRDFAKHDAVEVATRGLHMMGSSLQVQEGQATAPLLDALIDRVTKEFK